MAVSLTHTTVAVGTNAGNGEIAKEQWNENHTLTMAADKILGRATSGTGAVEELDCTAAGRALLDDATAADQRTTLGLGTGDSPEFTALNIGHATDTTLARAVAGQLTVEGKAIPYVIGASGASVSVSGVTTEETLATISVPGGAMGANGVIQIFTSFSVTNSSNNKTLRIRIGGISGTEFFNLVLTTNASSGRFTTIANQNSASAQTGLVSVSNANGVGSGTLAAPTATVNTASNFDIVITGQKASSGETLTLVNYFAVIYYGA